VAGILYYNPAENILFSRPLSKNLKNKTYGNNSAYTSCTGVKLGFSDYGKHTTYRGFEKRVLRRIYGGNRGTEGTLEKIT
jgi:hypothetical protein